MKTCAICRNCLFEAGSRGYSELTPGWWSRLRCSKGHNKHLSMMDSWDLFEKMRAVAASCPDYESVELEPHPNSD